MAATPANYFSDQMTLLTGNVGGAVQSLPQVSLVGGRERNFISRITLASQISGKVFAVARIPLYSAFLGILVATDTSLGSSTIAFGDAGNGNSAIYVAAQTFTATNTPTLLGLVSAFGVPITAGYDSVTGNAVNYSSSSGFGGLYEDIIMTVGAATFPASGNLVIVTQYQLD